MEKISRIRECLQKGYELLFTGDSCGNSYACLLLEDRPLHVSDLQALDSILVEFPGLLEVVQQDSTFLKVTYDFDTRKIRSAVVRRKYEGPYNETTREEVVSHLEVLADSMISGLEELEHQVFDKERPYQKRKVG